VISDLHDSVLGRPVFNVAISRNLWAGLGGDAADRPTNLGEKNFISEISGANFFGL
jgi:hypothetical protein